MGNCFIQYLPLNKAYGEHPFWMIEKLEFIRAINQKYQREV